VNVEQRREELIDALDRSMVKEDRSTKGVMESSHALMAFEMEVDPNLQLHTVARGLHERYKDKGYNHSTTTWADHFEVCEWLIDQTGGYNWVKGRSANQHRIAMNRDMSVESLRLHSGVLRTNNNGGDGEKWETTLRRLATQAANEAEIIEVKEHQAARTYKRKHLKAIHSDVVEGAEALLRAVNTMERMTA